jgi:hypothetical protein
MDMATCLKDETAIPRPNDISICIRCGNLAVFDNNLNLRALTEDEFKTIKSLDVPWLTILKISSLIKSRGNSWKPDSPPSN